MIDKILFEGCPELTNYVPWELIWKGYKNLTIREKIIWKFCELRHLIEDKFKDER